MHSKTSGSTLSVFLHTTLAIAVLQGMLGYDYSSALLPRAALAPQGMTTTPYWPVLAREPLAERRSQVLKG